MENTVFFIMIKVIIIRLRHKLRVIYSFYLLKGEPVIGVELKIYLNQWKPYIKHKRPWRQTNKFVNRWLSQAFCGSVVLQDNQPAPAVFAEKVSYKRKRCFSGAAVKVLNSRVKNNGKPRKLAELGVCTVQLTNSLFLSKRHLDSP